MDIVLTSWRQFTRSTRNLINMPIIIVLILALVTYFDPDQLVPIIKFAVSALLSTAPFIIFAVLTLAYIKASGAETTIAKAFVGRETQMIFFAAVVGGLAPFCSCEVIPFIAGLLAVGTPLSAVMAFWLASPLIDPPTIIITAGALGWSFALGKAIAAVSIGLIGGFAIKFAMQTGAFASPLRADKDVKPGCGTSPITGKPVWKFWQENTRIDQFKSEALSNGLMLVKWLSFAYVLEALLITYVPAKTIASVVGGEGITPIVVSAFVGIPAYLNGYAAPPLVAGLIEQGMGNGAAMSFLVAGAVSSIPAMVAVWSLVKPRVFAAYLSLGLTGAILAGLVFELVR